MRRSHTRDVAAPSGTTMSRRRRARRGDDGVTLVETIVAISLALAVLIATASGFALASQVERDTVSLNRARAVAEQYISKILTLPTGQVGHYLDDPQPKIVDLPEKVCTKNFSGVCTISQSVYQPQNRPATGAVMPLPSETVTYDGTVADETAKRAKRIFTVRTWVVGTNPGSTLNPNLVGQITEWQDRRVIIEVSWQSSGQEKTFTLTRDVDADPNCMGNNTGYDATTSPATLVGAGCLSWSAHGAPAPWPTTGDYSGGMPVRAAADGFYTNSSLSVRYYKPAIVSRLNTDLSYLQVTGATITLWNGTVRTMTKDASGAWITTIPAGQKIQSARPAANYSYFGSFSGAINRTLTINVTFANGAKGTTSFAAEPVGWDATNSYPTFLGVGTTGSALPGPTGTPSGTLRLGSSSGSAAVNGTITPRLCVRPDGTLWSTHRFFVDVANVNPQDDGAALHYTYSASTPAGTAAAPVPHQFTPGSFRGPNTTGETAVSSARKRVSYSLVSTGGNHTPGALHTVRYAIEFQSPADAALGPTSNSASPTTAFYPKFFTSSIDLNLSFKRQLDGRYVTSTVTIPVKVSTTGTTANCTTG